MIVHPHDRLKILYRISSKLSHIIQLFLQPSPEKVQNSLQINIWNLLHSTNLILSIHDRNVQFVAPSGISHTKRSIVLNIKMPFCNRETQITQNTVAPS